MTEMLHPTLTAETVTLTQLIRLTGLERRDDPDFFSEWYDDLPALSELEIQLLDQVKAGYLNLRNYPPLLENTVNTAILSPLLFIGRFFLPPFHIRQEQTVEFTTPRSGETILAPTGVTLVEECEAGDNGTLIKGRLDLLILNQSLWVTVVESKRLDYSVEAGLDQALAYLLADPPAQPTVYGMVTSGGSFIFLKLVQGTHMQAPQYATSDIFDVRNRGNALVTVLQILKRLAQLTSPIESVA